MARTLSSAAGDVALAAARDVLSERGLGGFTVEAVAAASGLAKTTLYRRWASRHDLLAATLRTLVTVAGTPNTGRLRDDLEACLGDLAAHRAAPGLRRVFLGVLLEAEHDPEIDAVRAGFVAEQQRPVSTIIELAIARGELPPTLDCTLALDLVIGPLLHRHLLMGDAFAETEIEVVVDSVIAACRAAGVPRSREASGAGTTSP